MKLKVNTNLLLIMIIALGLSQCSTVPIVSVIIVDSKGNPVKTANIKVTITQIQSSTLLGAGSTDATGTANVSAKMQYPATVTASDAAGDKFSVVTLKSNDDIANPVKVVENPLITKELP